jgi:hypothetical protein
MGEHHIHFQLRFSPPAASLLHGTIREQRQHLSCLGPLAERSLQHLGFLTWFLHSWDYIPGIEIHQEKGI